MTRDRASEIELINADVGVQWLFSFLSADRKKSYCLLRGSQRRSHS